MAHKATTTNDEIPLDHLVGDGPALQVVWLDPQDEWGPDARDAHRHDYHELFVLARGSMRHRIDDEIIEHGDGSVLLVGRGQTHTLEQASQVGGVVVRFAESMLADSAQQASPGWLLVRTRTCIMHPPAGERATLEQLVRLLDDELRRPRDAHSAALEQHYLSAALRIIDRWQQAQRLDVPAPRSPDVELFQQFARLLEAEYANHHDAGWYADQLAVSAGHLAGILTALTGRSTKRLVSDRVMTEAQRLLAHTNLTAQQVALRLGYDDPLYFSRVFRQHVGAPPTAYRARHAGATPP